MRRFGIQLISTPVVFVLTVVAATAALLSCEPGSFWRQRCAPLQAWALNFLLLPSSDLGQDDGAAMPRIDGPCCVYYQERFIAKTSHVPAAQQTGMGTYSNHRRLEI